MTSGYQPFLIAEMKTGISTYLQPWQRPAESFDPLVNAYVNRGIVNKRNGSSRYTTVADGKPIMGIMSFVDQSSGTSALLLATTTNLYLGPTFTAITPTAPFTGTIRNFFNYANWLPPSSSSPASKSAIYMTNNVNPITVWDGTGTAGLAVQPDFPIDSRATGYDKILKCLDIKTYKERLLFIRPTTTSGVENQSIRWSKIKDPTNAKADVAGNGGEMSAPTSDVIMAAEFIRDVLVVFFSHSTWIFRYTGAEFAPFRWDKINDSKNTTASYSSVSYDDICTAIGNTGLIACSGANVERYDTQIIDFYETELSGEFFSQCFAQRYDNLNQTWMLYASDNRDETQFPKVGGVAPGSDRALIYNFFEKSFATYEFSRPLTCLGTYANSADKTWADLTQTWASTGATWDSYSIQIFQPMLLAGDTTGNVWRIDDPNCVKDWIGAVAPATSATIEPDITTTRWNPLMQSGQKAQFGWIDIYYYVPPANLANPIEVILRFYADNKSVSACERTLTLDGPTNSTHTFKRIYINVIGEFIRMEIDPNFDAKMQFLGFILWVKPAGRLTP